MLKEEQEKSTGGKDKEGELTVKLNKGLLLSSFSLLLTILTLVIVSLNFAQCVTDKLEIWM